jgi:hypothetical protein
MRIGCLLIFVLMISTVARAAEPSTRPSNNHRRPGMSITEAENALGLSGPVRLASYSQSFAARTTDPHQTDRDHYTYSTPSWYPYWGCGYWGYGCYPGNCWRGYSYSFGAPASIFYGD